MTKDQLLAIDRLLDAVVEFIPEDLRKYRDPFSNPFRAIKKFTDEDRQRWESIAIKTGTGSGSDAFKKYYDLARNIKDKWPKERAGSKRLKEIAGEFFIDNDGERIKRRKPNPKKDASDETLIVSEENNEPVEHESVEPQSESFEALDEYYEQPAIETPMEHYEQPAIETPMEHYEQPAIETPVEYYVQDQVLDQSEVQTREEESVPFESEILEDQGDEHKEEESVFVTEFDDKWQSQKEFCEDF